LDKDLIRHSSIRLGTKHAVYYYSWRHEPLVPLRWITTPSLLLWDCYIASDSPYLLSLHCRFLLESSQLLVLCVNQTQLIHVSVQWMKKELGNSTDGNQVRGSYLLYFADPGRSLIPSYLKLSNKPLNVTRDFCSFFLMPPSPDLHITHCLGHSNNTCWQSRVDTYSQIETESISSCVCHEAQYIVILGSEHYQQDLTLLLRLMGMQETTICLWSGNVVYIARGLWQAAIRNLHLMGQYN
jgi:hypothetical protein